MTDKELWRRMENMATSERSLEREMSFMCIFRFNGLSISLETV